jgi:hypothetical protein
MKTNKPYRLASLAGAAMMVAALASTGCQSSYNGQTLPSPYYMDDDIQYYAPGPSMKLARTAAALKAAREEEAEIDQQK